MGHLGPRGSVFAGCENPVFSGIVNWGGPFSTVPKYVVGAQNGPKYHFSGPQKSAFFARFFMKMVQKMTYFWRSGTTFGPLFDRFGVGFWTGSGSVSCRILVHFDQKGV